MYGHKRHACRVHDMINRRLLNTKKLKMLVIDEADEMLSKGFKEHSCVVLHQSALSRRTTSESSETLSSPAVRRMHCDAETVLSVDRCRLFSNFPFRLFGRWHSWQRS